MSNLCITTESSNALVQEFNKHKVIQNVFFLSEAVCKIEII